MPVDPTGILKENSAILVKKVVGDVMQFTAGVLLPLLDSFAPDYSIFAGYFAILRHKQIALMLHLDLGHSSSSKFSANGGQRRHQV